MAAPLTPPPPRPDLPEGWFVGGDNARDYEIGRDTNLSHRGKPSAYIRSRVAQPAGFATLMQSFRADVYRTKRMRLSADVRSEQVIQWAAIWMRVDGPVPGRYVQFDNMHDRPIKGATDWHEVAIVLDVPPNSTMIAFGLLLRGPGQVWANSFAFSETDGREAPTGRRALPSKPDNLDFER
jgi:hypothetical protein